MTKNYIWACNVGGYVCKGAFILQLNSQGLEGAGRAARYNGFATE